MQSVDGWTAQPIVPLERLNRMRLVCLALAVSLMAVAASAQDAGLSSSGAGPSTQEDARKAPGPSGPTPQGAAKQAAPADLPVSLDHIREGLKKEQSLLRTNELPADFRIEIVEQQKIDELLKKLDFSSGPAPPSGVYGFEQQRRLFNPTDRPLMQPYAAFNGGELITIALENLIAKYLGGRLVNAVSAAERSRAERAAREEVDQAIAAYCAARPDRADIELCTNSTGVR
jgi:hypothetical protein